MKTTYNTNTIVSIKLITDWQVLFYRINYTHKEGWPWNRKIVPAVCDYDTYIELNKFFDDDAHKDYCYYDNDNHIYYKPFVMIEFNNGDKQTKYFDNEWDAKLYYEKLQNELLNNKIEFID